MSVTYVPRCFGGTIILQVGPPPASTVPTLQVAAVFRSGQVQATHRNGQQEATHRDGTATPGGR